MTAEKRGGGKARGSHWKGSRRWRRLNARIEKKNRRNPRPVPVFGECVRCRKKFVPDWLDISQCCSPCMMRNLAEFLGIKPEDLKGGIKMK